MPSVLKSTNKIHGYGYTKPGERGRENLPRSEITTLGQRYYPEETITPDSTLKDLGADSLDIADMIMQFEGIFGVEVKDEDAEKIKTIDEAVDYLHAARTK